MTGEAASRAAAKELAAVAGEAATCTRCDLYAQATQTVFGEGPVPAPLMLVGEQPGDQEDRKGHPFVGPAGRLLDECLQTAGIDRGAAYVTNAVKHFKWTPRGKRRIHQRPNTAEIGACRHWLEQEIAHVSPQLVVTLGATALRPFFGSGVTISRLRGAVQASQLGVPVVATIHPSAILRMDEPQRTAELDAFVADLRLAATTLSGAGTGA